MEEAAAIMPAVTLLGVGLLCILAARALSASPIVMFILAGLLIGPDALGLAQLNATTSLLAQLGVVFLLFEIGLGFSLKTVRESGRDLAGLAPAQMLVCTLGFAILARALALDWTLSLIIGAAAGISATAVVSRTLTERNLATCPLGRSATAVLVFQDIAGIFLLVFAATLGAGDNLATALGLAGLKAALAIAVAITLGRLVIGPLFRLLSRTRNDEIFTAAALLLVLATAAATGALGLSLTLGAFLAGVIVAQTPFRAVVRSEAKPFGALLLGFFFITVGMGLDWRLLIEQAGLIAAALAALRIMRDEPQHSARVMAIGARMRHGLKALGYNTGTSQTPISSSTASACVDNTRV